MVPVASISACRGGLTKVILRTSGARDGTMGLQSYVVSGPPITWKVARIGINKDPETMALRAR